MRKEAIPASKDGHDGTRLDSGGLLETDQKKMHQLLSFG